MVATEQRLTKPGCLHRMLSVPARDRMPAVQLDRLDDCWATNRPIVQPISLLPGDLQPGEYLLPVVPGGSESAGRSVIGQPNRTRKCWIPRCGSIEPISLASHTFRVTVQCHG